MTEESDCDAEEAAEPGEDADDTGRVTRHEDLMAKVREANWWSRAPWR